MTRKRVDVAILTVIPAELRAMLRALRLQRRDGEKQPDGSIYFSKNIRSHLNNREFRLLVGVIADVGNEYSAIAATQIIKDFEPQIMILVGIAAGMKGKVRIGEVIIGDRVVDYESASVEDVKGEVKLEPRPEVPRISQAVKQDLASYFPETKRLNTLFKKIGGKYPVPNSEAQAKRFPRDVASKIIVKPFTTIASGQKLLRKPQYLRTLRRTVHGKIEVGDMEASGFAKACDKLRTDWMVVRGISDFGDKFKNDEFHSFAATSATAALVDFLNEGLDLDYQKKEGPSSYVPVGELDEFARNSGIQRRLPIFDLRISLAHSYESILNRQFSRSNLTVGQLLRSTSNHPFLLISAPGGSGKSAVIYRLAVHFKKVTENSPFVLDFKAGTKPLLELGESPNLRSLFKAFSVLGSYSSFAASLKNAGATLLLLDGINEINAPSSDSVLRSIADLPRKHPTLRVIAADRMNARQEVQALRGTIAPLSEKSIRSFVPTGRRLHQEEYRLLSIPFFLDLQLKLWAGQTALDRSRETVVTRTEMFRKYFIEIGNIETNQFQNLAMVAFEAYKKFTGRVFDTNWWQSRVSKDTSATLASAGIVIDMKDHFGEFRSFFRHHLLHDYLVGCHLANLNRNLWKSDAFDIATFHTNSIEPLSFAAELLRNDADRFLIEVSDWSYRSANACIADLTRLYDEPPVSTDLRFAIDAKNAEKLFDFFESTSSDARKRLRESNTTFAKDFLRAASLEEVLQIAERYSPRNQLFIHWQRVFLGRLSLREVQNPILALDSDPISAWAAANTFRRIVLPLDSLLTLRAFYEYFRPNQRAILRWRIVHVLGKYPDIKNVELLLSATRSDRFEWVRYGALRSLMEIAFVSTSLRQHVLRKVEQLLKKSPSKLVVREILRTCLVRDATPDWYQALLPLAITASSLASEFQAEWKTVVATIRRRGSR